MMKRISSGHRPIKSNEVSTLVNGWRDPRVAVRQRALVDQQLTKMRAGTILPDFCVAADAVRACGLSNPLLIDVGCASGYYADVFTALAPPLRYIGTDYARTLIRQAGAGDFLVSDAARLPFRWCDILFAGGVLLCLLDPQAALTEFVRVASHFVILHRVPIIEAPSILMRKDAYGVPTIEWAFNRETFAADVARAGMSIVQTWPIVGFRAGRHPAMLTTYLCRASTSQHPVQIK